MKKNILIIGGSGFVGTNLLKKINKKKNYLFSTIKSQRKFIKIKGVKYFKGNLKNLNFCRKITKNIDTVYMCAAVSSGAHDIQNNPMFHVDDNILINMNTLKASSENKVKKFIFLSSNTVYPVGTKNMSENMLDYTIFHKYFNVGWMKIFSEKLCEMYKEKMNISIIRPGNLYGPHDKFDKSRSKVIPSLIKKFEENKTIEVWGRGEDIKDFIYIDDFNDALLKLVDKNKDRFSIFNIAYGKSISLKKIINFLKKIYNIDSSRIKFNKTKPSMIPIRRISNRKLNLLINHKNKFDYRKGITETIKWYKKNIK